MAVWPVFEYHNYQITLVKKFPNKSMIGHFKKVTVDVCQ